MLTFQPLKPTNIAWPVNSAPRGLNESDPPVLLRFRFEFDALGRVEVDLHFTLPRSPALRARQGRP